MEGMPVVEEREKRIVLLLKRQVGAKGKGGRGYKRIIQTQHIISRLAEKVDNELTSTIPSPLQHTETSTRMCYHPRLSTSHGATQEMKSKCTCDALRAISTCAVLDVRKRQVCTISWCTPIVDGWAEEECQVGLSKPDKSQRDAVPMLNKNKQV